VPLDADTAPIAVTAQQRWPTRAMQRVGPLPSFFVGGERWGEEFWLSSFIMCVSLSAHIIWAGFFYNGGIKKESRNANIFLKK